MLIHFFVSPLWIPYQLLGNCDVTAKALFAKLLSIGSCPSILHRLQAQVIGPGLSLNDPWSLVRNSFREKFKNDLLWVIFTPWAVIYKVRDFLQNWRVTRTPTLDLRALCERPLTTVSWIVSELRRYGLRLQPLLHLFQFSPKILNVFFFSCPLPLLKGPEWRTTSWTPRLVRLLCRTGWNSWVRCLALTPEVFVLDIVLCTLIYLFIYCSVVILFFLVSNFHLSRLSLDLKFVNTA